MEKSRDFQTKGNYNSETIIYEIEESETNIITN